MKSTIHAQNSPVCSDRHFTLLTNSILEYLMPNGISMLANISVRFANLQIFAMAAHFNRPFM